MSRKISFTIVGKSATDTITAMLDQLPLRDTIHFDKKRIGKFYVHTSVSRIDDNKWIVSFRRSLGKPDARHYTDSRSASMAIEGYCHV